MGRSRYRFAKVILFAVVLLGFGYLLGTLQFDYNFFTYAQESESKKYEGPGVDDVERPEKAIQTAQAIEKSLHYAASKVRPAVVTIYTKKEVTAPGFQFHFGPDQERFREFFEEFFPEQRSREITGLGSGVIIRENGYILTNHHVVEKSDSIEVLLSNQNTAEAEIVASDQNSDLAVIKIDRTGLPTAKFADSDNVRIGQFTLAVGTPFQLRNSVSIGHVSATHRAINFRRYEDLIQTDAPINKGNSGGPLVNIHGEVIGINTLILSQSGGSQGVGFAISSNLAKRTAHDLIEYGHVKRPWLGVVIQELTPEMAQHVDADRGVLVAEVKDGSPADKANLEAGDVIVEFNGEPVKTPHDLQRKVLAQSIDDKVSLKVKKQDGSIETVSTKLAELPNDSETESRSSEQDSETEDENLSGQLGMKLQDLSEEEVREMGVVPPRPMVRVEAVQRGSPASRADLQRGDIILRVGNESLTSKEEFNQILSKLKQAGQSKVLLHVHRDQNFFTLLPLNFS